MSKSMLSKKGCAVLSREEERDLLLVAKKGDRIAQERLIESNMGLILVMLKDFLLDEKIEAEDLIQAGKIGVYRAIGAYRMESDNKFITCARWWIMSEMKNALLDSRSIHIPKNKWDDLKGDSKIRESFGHGNLDEDKDLACARNALQLSSICMRYGEGHGECTLEDFLVGQGFNPEEDFFKNENSRKIDSMFELLSSREAFVLSSYFGYGCEKMSLTDIGKSMKVSKAYVSQIKERAIEKIRTSFSLDEFDLAA